MYIRVYAICSASYLAFLDTYVYITEANVVSETSFYKSVLFYVLVGLNKETYINKLAVQ